MEEEQTIEEVPALKRGANEKSPHCFCEGCLKSDSAPGVEGVLIEVGYRIDMRIDPLVLVENKTLEKILPIHPVQVLTYLKLSGLSLGLIIDWNVILLRESIRRVVRNLILILCLAF